MPIPISDQFPYREARNNRRRPASWPDLEEITQQLIANTRPTPRPEMGLPPLTRGFGPLDQSYFNRWEGHPRSKSTNLIGGGKGIFNIFDNLADMAQGVNKVFGGNDGPVAGANFQREQPNPQEVLLRQLENLINQGMQLPAGPSEADLQQALDQAAAGLQKQYGAQIGAYQQQNAGARKDVRQGAKAVNNMYGQLAGTYNRAGKREFRQGSRLADKLQDMGQDTAQTVTNQAQQINKAAIQGAAGLGLGNLAADLTNKTGERAQDMSKSILRRSHQAAEGQQRIAGNNRTFMQTSGQASRLEGTNRAADMYAELQDFIQANRAQIAALAGERAAAIAAAKAGIQAQFADAQSQYQEMRQDARQDMIDNNMELVKIALGMAEDREGGSRSGNRASNWDLLPDQMAGPSKILNRANDPLVTRLYEQLSGRGSMQRGYTGDPENPQTLEGNVANMRDWISDVIGDAKWGSLSIDQQNALVAALLKQLEGMAG